MVSEGQIDALPWIAKGYPELTKVSRPLHLNSLQLQQVSHQLQQILREGLFKLNKQ